MADDKGTSRRSFLGDLLTGAAGGWIALTSTSAVSAFLAACTGKKGDSAKQETPAPKPKPSKYGGPSVMRPEPMDMDRPVMVKHGGPAVDPPPRPVSMDMDPPPRPVSMDPPPPKPKYGGPGTAPVRTQPVTKYGGPVRRPKKYGGRIRRPKYGGRRSKYGGPATKIDL